MRHHPLQGRIDRDQQRRRSGVTIRSQPSSGRVIIRAISSARTAAQLDGRDRDRVRVRIRDAGNDAKIPSLGVRGDPADGGDRRCLPGRASRRRRAADRAAGRARREPARSSAPKQARDLSKVGATAADVKFMQGMIHHHAQAIDMTELLKTRTDERGHEEARPAHPGVADRRDQDDAALAAGARPGRAGSARDAHARHDHARHGSRPDDGRHADARGDGAARRLQGRRVRPVLPRRHDQAPRRRAHDGEGAVRDARRRAGLGHLRVRVGRRRRSADGNRSHERHARRSRSAKK